jgi:hypothetical protein
VTLVKKAHPAHNPNPQPHIANARAANSSSAKIRVRFRKHSPLVQIRLLLLIHRSFRKSHMLQMHRELFVFIIRAEMY